MVKKKNPLLFAMSMLCWLAVVGEVVAQGKATTKVNAASRTLTQIIATPGKAIPASLLKDAQAVAIVPRVIKVGVVVGGRHGEGVIMMRDASGAWGNPVFVGLTGGSVGWQIGVQSTDVVLVFKTKTSLDGFMKGKRLTLGADIAVAAGPLGREVQAGTDSELQAEIYSYSRSRGLFVGASLDGSMIEVDDRANGDYYGRPGVTTDEVVGGINVNVPAEAAKLKAELTQVSASVDAPR